MRRYSTQSVTELSANELDQVSGGVKAPRDASTGMATGRRIELPIQITTPVGTTS